MNECITLSGGAKSALPRQVDHLMKTITWTAAVEGRYQMLSGADVNTVAWVKETLAYNEGRNDVSLRMSKIDGAKTSMPRSHILASKTTC